MAIRKNKETNAVLKRLNSELQQQLKVCTYVTEHVLHLQLCIHGASLTKCAHQRHGKGCGHKRQKLLLVHT